MRGSNANKEWAKNVVDKLRAGLKETCTEQEIDEYFLHIIANPSYRMQFLNKVKVPLRGTMTGLGFTTTRRAQIENFTIDILNQYQTQLVREQLIREMGDKIKQV